MAVCRYRGQQDGRGSMLERWLVSCHRLIDRQSIILGGATPGADVACRPGATCKADGSHARCLPGTINLGRSSHAGPLRRLAHASSNSDAEPINSLA